MQTNVTQKFIFYKFSELKKDEETKRNVIWQFNIRKLKNKKVHNNTIIPSEYLRMRHLSNDGVIE